jgi:MFS family permease
MFSGRGVKVLRNRDFRLLFISQALSQVGSQAVTVAMALYITRRTGSATDLSIVLGAGMIPTVVLIVFGGVWADRLPRKPIMVISDSMRLVLHAALGTLIILGAPPIWLIAVIEAFFAAATAFFQPAYSGLVPQTVPESEIGEAQALKGGVENLAVVIGPIIATVLVFAFGAGEMFLVDALSFLASAVLVLRIHPRARSQKDLDYTPHTITTADPARAAATDYTLAHAEEEQDVSFFDDLRIGFREVSSRGWVWGTIIAYSGVLLVSEVPWQALAPIATRDIYGDVSYYGVMIALYGVGAVVGSLVASFWHPKHPIRLALILGVPWALLGAVLALGAPPFWLDIATLISGTSGALVGAWWETSLARHIPPTALSRVSAWDWMGSIALMPLGYAIVGPVSGVIGVRLVLGVGAVIGAVIAGAALLAPGAWSLPAEPVVADQPSSATAQSL